MRVVKTLRTSVSSARCVLDNGWVVKIPIELLEEDFIESDFVEVYVQYKKDLLYRTLVKPKRVPKVPKFVRDMSQFDASKEFSLLRSIVAKNASGFNWYLTSDELEDLTSDIFIHFWERNLYQGYDSSVVSYLSYLSRAVQNYIIDQFRSKKFQNNRKLLSLDKPIKSKKDSDEATTLASFLAAPENSYADELHFDPCLLEAFNNAVYALDCDGTGLKGVTYSDIFKVIFLQTDKTLDDIALASGYSRTTIASRRDRLIDWLRPIFQEWKTA